MHSVTPDHIVQQGIGDHESIDKKPTALSATAFYYHHALILTESALVLKKTEDAAIIRKLANEIRSTV